MPAIVTMAKNIPVPDFVKWTHVHKAGAHFQRPSDVPSNLGTSVLFICGRGQQAVDIREDCGFKCMLLFLLHSLMFTDFNSECYLHLL